MRMAGFAFLAAILSAGGLASAAAAQQGAPEQLVPVEETTPPEPISEPMAPMTPAPQAAPAEAAPAALDPLAPAAPGTGEAEPPAEAAPAVEVNPDDMADMLNSRQQLQQTFTLERTINGEVVDTEKRTVTFERGAPVRESETRLTTPEALKAAFDKEVLTRNEAFEEAKLDFTVADVNRDGKMTADEFAALVNGWREVKARDADAPDRNIARQRQYDAFLDEIDPGAATLQTEARARAKFSFMSGAAPSITREDYVREYLLDFDSMDENDDMLLKGRELMRFRALNRGESFDSN